jgi:unsaturated chondroitin disaccharide hydrolase
VTAWHPKHRKAKDMAREKITLNNPERFAGKHEIDREKLLRAAKAATDKLEAKAREFMAAGVEVGTDFPGTCSVEYKYVRNENKNWVGGMYTGCYWLAYELTGNEFFREVAEKHLATYRTRVDKRIGMDDHDVGFTFTPSCVAAYKLTGNEEAKQTALDAAEYFRKVGYSDKGKFIIRFHGGWDRGPGCRTMMDSLMNAPLFFWAGEVTGEEKYTTAAHDHVLTTEKYLIRKDSSSYHHYQFDPATAGPVKGVTLQGNGDESCWARGHAWGVYGFPIAYSYTKDPVIKAVHKDITVFMLNHLLDDLVPNWDYDFMDPNVPRDTSSGAISSCGLHEMARLLPDDDPDKAFFENASAQLLEAIIDNYTGDIGIDYDGLIHHVTHALPQGQGIDECAVYGDYFYLEALLRHLKPDWQKYW